MLECLQATDDRGRKSSVILNLYQDRVVLRELYSRETESCFYVGVKRSHNF